MKLHVIDQKKATKGDVELPPQFSEPVRQDLISRAVLALQANARQPYGADPRAGKRASATISKRRRDYRGSYGHGISRSPRKILTRRGTRMYWVGAFAPNTVGGRAAHPPKAEKSWRQKLNKKENQKAIRSALAAVVDKALVARRGHRIPAEYPFILDSSFESLARTREVEDALVALGFGPELDRATKTTVRAGKAKMRGRKTKRPTGLLFVVSSDDARLAKAAANLPGVDIVQARGLNAELLAPGTHPGRATLFTEQAIKIIREQNLFLGKSGAEPKAKATHRARTTPTRTEATHPSPIPKQRETAHPEATKGDSR
jgi:large subunit ribosomal protein L4e